jgi:hypothetical protein
VEKANPRSLPQPLTSICALLAAGGVAAFVYGLTADPTTTWLSFQSNFMFFATLAQAGVILSCIFTIVNARWPGPLRRIAEGLGAWVPVTLVLFVVSWLAGSGDYLFEWQREGAVHGKEPWLNEVRLWWTDFGILAVMTLLSIAFLRASIRPTLGSAAAGATGFAKSMAERFTAGWRGDAEEIEAAEARKRALAPIICLIFALGYSVLVFDQIMSMEQTWYSNLFGAFVSWGGILSAVAAIALVTVLNRNAPGIGPHLTEKRRHDIGKMLFAFSIFWMYLFFSQYLVIWYGNLPEETLFFRDRLGPQFVIDKGFSEAAWARAWTGWDFRFARLDDAYGWTSMIVWACCWIIPFWVLLGQYPKKNPYILGGVSTIVLVGLWIERNLLIWPSVIKDGGFVWFGGLQMAIAFGFLGAYTLVFLMYTRVFPSLAVPDTD